MARVFFNCACLAAPHLLSSSFLCAVDNLLGRKRSCVALAAAFLVPLLPPTFRAVLSSATERLNMPIGPSKDELFVPGLLRSVVVSFAATVVVKVAEVLDSGWFAVEVEVLFGSSDNELAVCSLLAPLELMRVACAEFGVLVGVIWSVSGSRPVGKGPVGWLGKAVSGWVLGMLIRWRRRARIG